MQVHALWRFLSMWLVALQGRRGVVTQPAVHCEGALPGVEVAVGACRTGLAQQDQSLIQVRGRLLAPVAEKVDTSCNPGGMCPKGAIVLSGDTVFLASHTGLRLAVDRTEVDASGLRNERWELFSLIKAMGGGAGISSGDKIFLKAHTGSFLAVNGSELFAKDDLMSTQEMFRVLRRAGSGPLLSGDDVSLVAHTQKRVTVQGPTVLAQGEHDLERETLTVQKVTPPWLLPATGGPLEAVPGDVVTTTPLPLPMPSVPVAEHLKEEPH